MSYDHIRVRPIAAALGAEVSGIDLSQPLDLPVRAELEHAWMAYQVLFFRDQPITVEQHKEFARNFGSLHVHPVLQQRAQEGHPEVVVLESDGDRPYLANRWHSDVTFQKKPPLGSILRAVDVPDAGGDTMWASVTAAYDGLSETMQQVLSGLRAVHDGGGFRAIARGKGKEDLEADVTAEHPVVRTHPITGRKGIFVNRSFTRGIVGMHPRESRALLHFLFDHVSRPEYTCRFHWQKDSIAMWDNRATQHCVVTDNVDAHRRMERITIEGDEPY